MIRPAPTRTPQANNPTRAALTWVNAEYRPPEPTTDATRTCVAAIARPRGDAKVNDLGVGSSAPALVPAAPPNLSTDIAMEDWDDLFCAVKARLRLSVGERVAAAPEAPVNDAGDRVRASVLECVEALDQLQATQRHELARRQRLELQVLDARTALAQARAELAGAQVEERLARHLALHDSLTSLPNRTFFRERLDHALTLAEPVRQALAVLYLDLDDFKPINDAYGHATGDELLRIVAARLTQTVRAEDMVSRLGGDEFACLLGGLPSREKLSHLARNLVDAVSAPVKIGQLKLTVRPSIGIALCQADGATAETLLKNADAAMYQAKRRQTGYAFFDQHADV